MVGRASLVPCLCSRKSFAVFVCMGPQESLVLGVPGILVLCGYFMLDIQEPLVLRCLWCSRCLVFGSILRPMPIFLGILFYLYLYLIFQTLESLCFGLSVFRCSMLAASFILSYFVRSGHGIWWLRKVQSMCRCTGRSADALAACKGPGLLLLSLRELPVHASQPSASWRHRDMGSLVVDKVRRSLVAWPRWGPSRGVLITSSTYRSLPRLIAHLYGHTFFYFLMISYFGIY